MKQQSLITILLTVFMSMTGVKAVAHDIEVENADGVKIFYVWINNKTELAVSYQGSKSTSFYNEYSGDVVIPETVEYEGNTYNVTAIGNYAFLLCKGLTSITIPNSVSSIDEGAFRECTQLTSMDIPNSVSSIGGSAFYGCSSLISIEIPNGVTSIGGNTFQGCNSLTSVNIPNSVVSIGFQAFADCSSLLSIEIPDGVTFIDNSAFYGCSVLTSITIPNSVTSIGGGAFTGTPWYDNQPDGLVYAGKVAYKYKGEMPSNTSITIKDGTCSITGYAFSGYKDMTSVNIPNSVTTIGRSAFSGCKGLLSIDIPNSVNTIENEAFTNCTSLTSVNISNNVTSIKDNTFSYCISLTFIDIPNSVTSIGSYAFSNCSNLTSVTIPNSVTSIGGYAFEDCISLNRVNISNLSKWCRTSFTSISSNPLSLAGHLYLNGEEITDLVILDDVTSIADYAFVECKNIVSVTIPESVTAIGKYAFYNCSKLASLTISETITSYGAWAFAGCSSLTLPEYLTRFFKREIHVEKAGTLYNLIPADEKYVIEELTLTGELNGTDLGLLRDMAGGGDIETMDVWLFSNGTPGKLRVLDISDVNIVAGGTYVNYIINENDGRWKGLPKNRSLSNDNEIPILLFCGCGSLSHIKLPNSITTIGRSAFDAVPDLSPYSSLLSSISNSLVSVVIGSSVTSIGSNAFGLCNKLTSIKVNSDNQKYDSRNDCNAIIETSTNTLIVGCKNTIIPNSVTSVGVRAFNYCSALTSVTIPNSVTSIDENAFYFCSGLTSVTIDNKEPFVIGSGTFSNRANATLYVPSGSKAAYEAADYWKEFKEIKEFAKDEEVTCAIEKDNTATVTTANDPTEKDVVIPESVMTGEESHPVTAIGENAFKDNTELALVCIPETIEEIGDKAFAGCNNLSAIYSYSEDPIALGSGKATVRTRANGDEVSASNVFAEVNKNTCILYVPKNCGDKYRAAVGWGEFENIVEMKSNKPGDANNDGDVVSKDIDAAVGYIMEGKTENFIFMNADVKTDSRINADDIVNIVKIILTNQSGENQSE